MNAKHLSSYLALQKLVGKKFREASRQQSITVCASMGSPVFIFSGFDETVVPIYPQLVNVVQGKEHLIKALQMAAYQGYNSDLCSDIRCEIGSQYLKGGIRSRIIKPDFVLGMNFTCSSEVALYNSWVQQYPEAEHYIVDSPHLIGDEIPQNSVEYVKKQLIELIEKIEKTMGLSFNMEKLRKATVNISRSYNLMNKIILLATHNPSPICMTSFQPFLIPLAYYPHYDVTYEYLIELKQELEQTIETLTEKKERIRLCWDFLPLYKYMNDIHELLSKHDAKIVISTSLTAAMEWPAPELFENTSDVLGLLAYAWTQHHFKRNYHYKTKILMDWIKTYKINGIIFHSARNCKAHSLNHFLIKEELEKSIGIPSIVFEADMLDPSGYSKSQILNRLEAFLETM